MIKMFKNYKNLYFNQLEENKKIFEKNIAYKYEIQELKEQIKESKSRKKMQQLIEERNHYIAYSKRLEEKITAYEKIYGKKEKNE